MVYQKLKETVKDDKKTKKDDYDDYYEEQFDSEGYRRLAQNSSETAFSVRRNYMAAGWTSYYYCFTLSSKGKL